MLERKHEELGRDLEVRAGGAAGRPRGRARRRRRRRPPAPHVHRLPSGALDRGARRAHAAPARRPDTDEIARAFLVPEPTVAQRIVRAKRTLADGGGPVRGPARRRARRAAVVGARGHLPHLQRGLLGDRRRRLDAPGALRGRAAARPHPGRARPGGARGARPGRADGDPGVALARAERAVGRARPAARPGPRALGPAPRSAAASPRSSAPRRSAARAAPTRCRPRSPPATRARARPSETDWARIAALYDALAELAPLAGRRAEPRGRGGAWRSARRRACELVDALTSRALARGLPPAAERARRPARQARPPRRGPRRVRARGGAHAQRARARRCCSRGPAASSAGP